jgi:hypothetical protein
VSTRAPGQLTRCHTASLTLGKKSEEKAIEKDGSLVKVAIVAKSCKACQRTMKGACGVNLKASDKESATKCDKLGARTFSYYIVQTVRFAELKLEQNI